MLFKIGIELCLPSDCISNFSNDLKHSLEDPDICSKLSAAQPVKVCPSDLFEI